MGDTSYFLLMLYGVIAVAWFGGFFVEWFRRHRGSFGVDADRVWCARMALVAPVWPLFLLFVACRLLAERWRPAGVGHLIGDFMLDAKGRSDD